MGCGLYLLKRARGEPAGIETAFSGFRLAFLDLFLVGLVATVLKILGFICLILPGIYLVVAWMFASILVIDKGLDFWSAMELSRKVVTRHWWKAFGFVLVLLLVNLGGLLLCGLGFLITTPLTLAATVYAYEDIFGTGRRTAGVAAGVRRGPSGTKIVSATEGAYAGVRGWKLAGVLAAALVLLLFVLALGASRARQSRQEAYRAQAAAREREIAAAAIPEFSYGAVQERLLELTNVTRRALNLVSGNYVTSTPDGPLDWDNLSTEKLQSAGVDLYLKGGAPEADTNQNQSITPQLSTLGFRALSPVVADDSNISNAVYAATQSDTQEQSRTAGLEAAINGTQLMSFVTRDGTEGLSCNLRMI